jgi:hexosaminidase
LVRDGRVLARAALDLHHHGALGRFVDLQHPYSPRYPAGGPGALTDGILGSSHFNDGRWQGFEGEDMVAVIDLGQPRVIESVACRFLQSVPSWIWMPRVMEVNLSDDGRRFRPFTTADHDVDERAREARVRELVAATAPDIARYVRVRARSMGSCPQWHPGAGGPAWVFADEIRINAE